MNKHTIWPLTNSEQKVLKALKGKLLQHPSDKEITKIADELYTTGLMDGENDAIQGLVKPRVK